MFQNRIFSLPFFLSFVALTAVLVDSFAITRYNTHMDFEISRYENVVEDSSSAVPLLVP